MAKRRIGPILGQRVRLRLLEETDLPMTLAWRNQEHIRKWFVHADIISWEQHKEWCAQYFQRDNDFIFIIEEMRDLHKPVGQIALYNIEWDRKQAEYGRLLIGEPEAVGKGLAKEATRVLLAYAFTQLGLEKIVLEVMKGNTVASAIYLSMGFVQVGERDNLIVMECKK